MTLRTMFEIALVNMPFALPDSPSLALTQLQAVVAQTFPGRASARIVYLNHDIFRELSASTYWFLSDPNSPPSGLGDWVFRHLAFPDAADNLEAYLRQYGHRLRATPGMSAELDLPSHLQRIRLHLADLLPRLIRHHRLDQFPLVAFTSMFSQNVACLALAQLLKQISPDILTAMGGANCTPPMGHVLAACAGQIDFVFAGPALVTFPRFVSHLIQGNVPACHDIPGVLSRQRIQRGPPDPDALGPQLSLDTQLPLDFTDFFDSLQRLGLRPRIPPALPLQTARGCWWGQRRRCTFCSDNIRSLQFQAMSPQYAIRQFHRLLKTGQRHGVQTFEATENILPPGYVSRVLPRIRVPSGTSVFYEVRPHLSLPALRTLVSSGVRRVLAGVESLCTDTLRLMNKGVTAFDNIVFLKNCLRAGLQVQWNLLVGTPREEPRLYPRYCSLLPDLTHLPPPSVMDQIRFRRFSEYHDHPSQFNLRLQPAPFYHLTYPFPDHEQAQLAFEFHNTAASPTAEAMRLWLPRLLPHVRYWQARWASNGRDHPELSLVSLDDQPHILDTRDGTRRIRPITPLERQLLLLLEKPADRGTLQTRLAPHSPHAVRQALSQLTRDRLLFQEHGRFLSLVMKPMAR